MQRWLPSFVTTKRTAFASQAAEQDLKRFLLAVGKIDDRDIAAEI